MIQGVFADIDALVNMLEVLLQLFCAGILFRPSPSLVYFWDRERVDWILAVDSSSGISILSVSYATNCDKSWLLTIVPMPDPTKPTSCFDQFDVETLLSQLVK